MSLNAYSPPSLAPATGGVGLGSAGVINAPGALARVQPDRLAASATGGAGASRDSRGGGSSAAQVAAGLGRGGRRASRVVDLFFSLLAHGALLLVLALFAAIIVMLLVDAWPSIHTFGWRFLTSADWDPVQQKFGGLPMVLGTLVTSAIALIIAVPVSFGIALFLTELAPVWLRRPLGTAIELLAAIPSIVYGMWGLLVFSPVLADWVQAPLQKLMGNWPLAGALVSGPPVGIGLLAAGIILAVMITPFISAVMRDVFAATPPMLKESAHGLGATTWEVVRHVVLPNARAGVIGGIMLGLGRALGETMAVTFVIGNMNGASSFSLFDAANSITSTIANEFAEAAPGLHRAALMELGLLLFAITAVVLAASRLLLKRHPA